MKDTGKYIKIVFVLKIWVPRPKRFIFQLRAYSHITLKINKRKHWIEEVLF